MPEEGDRLRIPLLSFTGYAVLMSSNCRSSKKTARRHSFVRKLIATFADFEFCCSPKLVIL